MSIASEVSRLQGAKEALAGAIAAKGVAVPEGTALDGYAALVAQIPQGGGMQECPTDLLSISETGIYYGVGDQSYLHVPSATEGEWAPIRVIAVEFGANLCLDGCFINVTTMDVKPFFGFGLGSVIIWCDNPGNISNPALR